MTKSKFVPYKDKESCGVSDWRRASVPRGLGASVRCLGKPRHCATPSHTRGLGVVDRTLGECPVTCSSRHLTSHALHSYISTTSSSPNVLYFVFVWSRSVRLRAWGSKITREFGYTSRLRPKTETHKVQYMI